MVSSPVMVMQVAEYDSDLKLRHEPSMVHFGTIVSHFRVRQAACFKSTGNDRGTIVTTAPERDASAFAPFDASFCMKA